MERVSLTLILFITITLSNIKNSVVIANVVLTPISDLDEFPPQKTVRSPYYAFSPVTAAELALEEQKIYKLALNYTKLLKDRLFFLDGWIADYDGVTKPKITTDVHESDERQKLVEWEIASQVSGHPFLTYRMMRRFAYDLEDIVTHVSRDNAEESSLLERINDFNSTISLPNRTDVLEVTESIIRLHNIYDLAAKDLMNGIIANKSTPVELTNLHAFDIGKHALALEMYPEAWDWLQTLQRQLLIKPDPEVDLQHVRNQIRQLIIKHDGLHDNLNDKNFYMVNTNRFDTKIASHHALMTEKASQVKRTKDLRYISEDFAFMYLCKGDYYQSDAEKSKLYCLYETKLHPFWTINPLKIEVLSWKPYLIQIYDVINENTIEYLKTTASPALQMATVAATDSSNMTDYLVSLTHRSSTHAFLSEEKYQPLQKLAKLIELMTNLEVLNNFTTYNESGPRFEDEFTSEWIQVAAYTFGGHFTEHVDALDNGANETAGGDRMATFMIYLNDVELGGYTAFPEIGTAIAPIKRSALFWYDLLKNGLIDERTIHGGCPVIFGKKWVANKWIHYNANFLRRKCSLDRSL